MSATLAELLQEYCDSHSLNQLEGIVETEIPGVWLYRSSKGNARQPFIYQSGVIVLAQGHKTMHLGGESVPYGPEDYLVVGVPMPLECEAIPEEGKPLLGLSIDVDTALLQTLVGQLNQQDFVSQPSDAEACGLRSVQMEPMMLESCLRLVRALNCGLDAKILGQGLLTEVAYRALTGANGNVLFDLANHDGQYARIAKALSKVHRDYSAALTVQELASEANMSVSAFHQAFRTVTLESPLQYLKKVRLNKAKDLIQLEGKRVSDAARTVGYVSSSQFSREFKRLFNVSPKAA